MTEEEWRRHERGAWLRWGVTVLVALLSAVIAGHCAGPVPQIPPPPPLVR